MADRDGPRPTSGDGPALQDKSGIDISTAAVPDPEKNYASDERFGDQIPAELLAELAPNGEGDYIRDCVNGMSEEEAYAIVQEGLRFHSDDWNFPSDMRERMSRLVSQGPKQYGPFYGRDLRIDAAMLRYSSPYPGVRAVADPLDDENVPVETIRAYFLGVSWAVVGTFIATFFNSRFPSISLSGSVIQILLYPCAKFLVFVLPDWGVTVWGTRHSLNPGPWTFKEQMFSTITYNVAIYTTNAYTMILVQRMPVYYGETFVNFGYQLMLTFFVQLMGMGFAGYLRRFSVYPVKALWPTVLPILAMNRALTRPDAAHGGHQESANGWTISRYRFFFYCAVGMFFYYWLPGYLFTALSTFNWMTWIAPKNVTLAILTGSSLGLGLFNPLTTFDWNVATSSYAALAQPFFSTATMYAGSLLGGLIILGIYYSNMYNTAYLPINSSSAFANNGTSFVVQNVIVNNTFVEALYQEYSPPFYTAGYILTVGGNFAFYPIYFLYIMVNQWKTVSNAYIDFYKGLRYGKGNYENATDVHSRLMARYKEVPDWWFLAILLGALIVSIVFLKIYPMDTPVWLVFLLLGINLVFAVPLSFLSATTGTNLGLGSLIEVITGYLLPGKPNAFLFAQTLGSWALAGYGDNYVQDNKMAHYVKIAPRAVFRGQIGTIIITCFVAVATQNFIIEHVQGLCTADQPSRFTCANDGNPMYASSLMWGLLGSNRMFGSLYPLLKWCFLIGFGVAVIFLVGQGYGPIYLPRVRLWLEKKVSTRSFGLMEKTLFPFVASLLWLNPVLVLQGIQHWAPSNMSYKTPGFILSFIFMYWMPRHRLAWWERYNYTLSAALTAGVAVSALVMFFAIGYNPVSLKWWGNTVSSAGVDGSSVGIMPLPERGYFGPAKGTFP
ncbi:oligopeptide transporter [Ophiostoma piceae UAMH 11346]|uniref:Oligopeptide transporter n=1 Tax=Ophiostoma piceae (strain UAMH 11346) TaxID=1262450 RepID=S3C1V8_OPHP1|nr:oligopeptide transporter [Ophiostoma piceae UAMH 11346]